MNEPTDEQLLDHTNAALLDEQDDHDLDAATRRRAAGLLRAAL